MSANNSLKTCENIVTSKNSKSSVYGVILDSTNPYKTLDSRDFVTKIKIFDNTLNYKTKKNQENIYIFIYSEDLDNCPVINKIGDIIYLKNFDFSIYENKVKGTFNKFNSTWILFDKNKNSGYKGILSSKGNFSADIDKKSLDKVRDFSQKFFQDVDIENFSWYSFKFPKNFNKEKIIKIEDVDLIVKIVTVTQVVIDDNCYYKIVFIDSKKNMYFSEFNGNLKGLISNSVAKLRSINIYLHNDEKKIEFRTYSNILFLDNSFVNSKRLIESTKNVEFNEEDLKLQHFSEMHLDKMVKANIEKNIYEYEYLNKEDDSQNILNLYNYNEKEYKKREISSLILNKHKNLKVTNLADIKKNFESKKLSKEVFRVKCNILKVHNNFPKMVKLYSKKKGKNWELKDCDKALKEAKDLEIKFHNIFTIKEGKQQFDIILNSENFNNKSFFNLLNLLPDTQDVNSWKNLDKKVINKFNEKLKNLEQKENNFEFILKLDEINEKRELFIMDSILWFKN